MDVGFWRKWSNGMYPQQLCDGQLVHMHSSFKYCNQFYSHVKFSMMKHPDGNFSKKWWNPPTNEHAHHSSWLILPSNYSADLHSIPVRLAKRWTMKVQWNYIHFCCEEDKKRFWPDLYFIIFVYKSDSVIKVAHRTASPNNYFSEADLNWSYRRIRTDLKS